MNFTIILAYAHIKLIDWLFQIFQLVGDLSTIREVCKFMLLQSSKDRPKIIIFWAVVVVQ